MRLTPDMSADIEIQKVEIDPLGCFRQSLKLVEGQYWLLVGISALAMLIGGAVPIALIGPMMCGAYLCFLEKHRGGEVEFELLFDGFDHFVPSLIATLIMTGITLLAFIPALMVMFAGLLATLLSFQARGAEAAAPAIVPIGATSLLLLGLIALLLVVSLFFIFAFPLIVDRKLSGPAALGVSARAVARNFGGLLGLMLINVVLGIAGVLACYVGTFFVLPISFGAMTIAYRKLFPPLAAGEPGEAEGAAAPAPLGPAESPS